MAYLASPASVNTILSARTGATRTGLGAASAYAVLGQGKGVEPPPPSVPKVVNPRSKSYSVTLRHKSSNAVCLPLNFDLPERFLLFYFFIHYYSNDFNEN